LESIAIGVAFRFVVRKALPQARRASSARLLRETLERNFVHVSYSLPIVTINALTANVLDRRVRLMG
jgi:hypothetical protein